MYVLGVSGFENRGARRGVLGGEGAEERCKSECLRVPA